MQLQTWDMLMIAARAEYGEYSRTKSTEDFGFHHPRQWVEEWFMMLNRFKILPGAGGWMDQDHRVRQDLLQIMALYGEALDAARPNDGP